jgi:hypothetical protein
VRNTRRKDGRIRGFMGFGGVYFLELWRMLISLILRKCGFLSGIGGLRCLERELERQLDHTRGMHVEDKRFDLTPYRIQTWALEEARRRLEAEGILPDPDDEAKK